MNRLLMASFVAAILAVASCGPKPVAVEPAAHAEEGARTEIEAADEEAAPDPGPGTAGTYEEADEEMAPEG